MSDPRPRSTDCGRGQTLPDFAVGIAIFLVTITFVVVFVPQLIVPFEDQEQPAVAERIANDLSRDLLAERGTPSMLNESRTLAFFNDSLETERLGVDSTYSVNVTLRNASSDARQSAILCDSGGGSIVDCDDAAADTLLGAGPSVPQDDRSVGTARVGVFTSETDAVLEVRVW